MPITLPSQSICCVHRALLLSHFNEAFHRADCGLKCDNCVADKAAALVDITLPLAGLCHLLSGEWRVIVYTSVRVDDKTLVSRFL